MINSATGSDGSHEGIIEAGRGGPHSIPWFIPWYLPDEEKQFLGKPGWKEEPCVLRESDLFNPVDFFQLFFTATVLCELVLQVPC